MTTRPVVSQLLVGLAVLLGIGGLGGTLYFGYELIKLRLQSRENEVGGLLGLLGGMGEGALKGFLVISVAALGLGAALYFLARRR